MADRGQDGIRMADATASRRSLAFYVETIILVAFLLFASIVLVRIFAQAKLESADAAATQKALLVAQDASEAFSASPGDATAISAALSDHAGIEIASASGDAVVGTCDGMDVSIAIDEQPSGAGTMSKAHIVVSASGKELCSLDTAAYISGRG